MHELDLEYWKKASEVRPSLFSFRSSKGTDGEAVRGHFGMEPGPHARFAEWPAGIYPCAARGNRSAALKNEDARASPTSVQLSLRSPGCTNATCVSKSRSSHELSTNK